jgi:DNA-binding beta-propeller fold protein YncE
MIRASTCLVSISLLACSSADYALMASEEPSVDESDYDNEGSWFADTGSSAADSSYEDDYEPEAEDDFARLQPAALPDYVFVANPGRNTLSRINVDSLSVLTTEVGVSPAVVLSTPDETKAVVFNKGSNEVSVVDAQSMSVEQVEVREDYNQMSMSPGGGWVVCYYDEAAVDPDDPETEGARSFNEVSLVDLEALSHTAMVVGFNPRDVQFSDDGQRAVVVSDAWLAVIDLDAEVLEPTRIQISDDTVDPPEAEEVVLTPDGGYALIRQFGVTDLVLVNLDSGELDYVAVGDNPTDIDVTPDGNQAVAVARGSSELWIYDLEDLSSEPDVIPMPQEEVFGSLVMSPDGETGILFSTATGAARYGSWDRLEENPLRAITTRALVKPIDKVEISPDGSTAVIFHPLDNGSEVESDSLFYNSYALTMIDMSDFFANPLRLNSEPIAYDHTADGLTGFVVLEGEPYLEVLHYDSLLFDEIELKSDPVYLGVLPETRQAFVSQEHDLGRISFYDPDTEELETITGFELNAEIEQ